MRSFSEVCVRKRYYSPKNDIVKDFFIPVLENAKSYDRASGFFTSGSLVEISLGVCDLASRGGHIRVLTSPRLSEEDIVAIKQGCEYFEVVGNAMVRDFDRPTKEDLIGLDRLALLSELISSGALEIKVCVMRNLDDYPNAIFHPKFGIMKDENGEVIIFDGSMNDSVNGYYGSWESVRTERYYEGDDLDEDDLEPMFKQLWENRDPDTLVLDFPKVAAEMISEYHNPDRSMLDLDRRLLEKYDDRPESVFFKTPDWFEIREYQSVAVDTWVGNGYRGLFNMATGTGKTLTALSSLERLYNDHPDDGIFTVITAPQKHLVDQWADEVRKFGVNPIVGHSDSHSTDWKSRFRKAITSYMMKPKNVCLVTTISSFCSSEVQSQLKNVKNLCVVSDEAHNMGSTSRLQKLPQFAKYRLALSATIDRYKDELGTNELMEYFGPVCINFTLDDAIGKYLTRYNYYPIVCNYNEAEYGDFILKNDTLDTVLRMSSSKAEIARAKEDYNLYCYTLNSKMESKFTALVDLLSHHLDDDHMLVYCGKTRIDDEGDFEKSSHEEKLKVIDKTSRLIGKHGLGLEINRITYKEKAQERKAIFKEFEDGNIAAIVAISCLDEGVDIPSIRTAIIMTSSDNPREYVQRRGRVLRLYDGKDHADIYDLIVIPRDLSEVQVGDRHSDLELRMLSKELRRMIEFSRSSMNSEETEELFNKIQVAYGMDIETIIDTYGEMI